MIDRDVLDSTWNRYMKKFGDKYQLVKDKNNIWQIKCKFGNVQLYSMVNHQLCFVGDFKTKTKLTWFKKSLDFPHKITQEGDTDIVIMFDEKLLDSTAKAVCIYNKVKLSDERRKQLSDNMSKVRAKKQGV